MDYEIPVSSRPFDRVRPEVAMLKDIRKCLSSFTIYRLWLKCHLAVDQTECFPLNLCSSQTVLLHRLKMLMGAQTCQESQRQISHCRPLMLTDSEVMLERICGTLVEGVASCFECL